jgi:hypothetical protein
VFIGKVLQRHKSLPSIPAYPQGVRNLGSMPLYRCGVGMKTMLIVQVGMSIFLGLPAIYVLLSNRYVAQEKHWAYSTLGTILGFWLRGKS